MSVRRASYARRGSPCLCTMLIEQGRRLKRGEPPGALSAFAGQQARGRQALQLRAELAGSVRTEAETGVLNSPPDVLRFPARAVGIGEHLQVQSTTLARDGYSGKNRAYAVRRRVPGGGLSFGNPFVPTEGRAS